MITIEFVYKGISTWIQCNPNEQMKSVIGKFITKAKIQNPNSVYFYMKEIKLIMI